MPVRRRWESGASASARSSSTTVPATSTGHFKQFATYSLLDASRQQVVLSKKEAFCLAPTDGIDA